MTALSLEWITFEKARETIISEISKQISLEEEAQEEEQKNVECLSRRHQLRRVLLRALCTLIPSVYHLDAELNVHTIWITLFPSLVALVLLIVACVLNHFHRFVVHSAIIAIVILAILIGVNLVLTLRYHNCARNEMKNKVCDILDHYVSFIECHSTRSRIGSFAKDSLFDKKEPESLPTVDLNSGHSHVCIISVFRENKWQRLPSLLLVKGDIISLMAGDVAPARAFELVPDTSRDSSRRYDTSSKNQHSRRILSGWKLGNQVPRGAKILLRDDRKSYSKAKSSGKDSLDHDSLSSNGIKPQLSDTIIRNSENGEEVKTDQYKAMKPRLSTPSIGGAEHRHKHSRSIKSDSIEVLTLHSDMRCFILDETPISLFCKSMFGEHNDGLEKSSAKGMRNGDVESPHVYIPHQAGRSNIENGTSYLRQQFTFLHNKSTTYCILSCVVVSIISCVRLAVVEQDALKFLGLTIVFPIANVILCFFPISLTVGLVLAEALATAKILATSEALIRCGSGNSDMMKDNAECQEPTHQKRKKRKRQMKEYISSPRQDFDDDDDDDSSLDSKNDRHDEYYDEDLDDRIGKVSRHAQLNISARRVLQYFFETLNCRFNLKQRTKRREAGGQRGAESCDQALLPIPLASTRIVETLGAVTMVCFVDDDLVCENFSMSEEIYLLRNSDGDDGSQYPPMSSPLKDGTAANVPNGVVLDLHANSMASGSRFENPKWFLHLPSLKPIGLNAMLSYRNSIASPLPTIAGKVNDGNNVIEESNQLSKKQQLLHPHTYAHPPTKADQYPSLPSFVAPLSEDTGSCDLPFFHISMAQRSVIEKSLVKYSKNQHPLEYLRELSEEIGFDDADAEHFRNVLDVSVLAPGLGEIRLVEDTHAWGQEQTRKRGIFEPHLVGSVFEDIRPGRGSLQLMSHGYPPLMMSYCKEYWDGSDISPLTENNRKELLAIFERWDLEDFDVIAFAYSPVPVSVRESLQSSESENGHKISVKKVASSRSNNSMLSSGKFSPLPTSNAKSLIFVDPSSENELKAPELKLPKLRDLTKLDEMTLDSATPKTCSKQFSQCRSTRHNSETNIRIASSDKDSVTASAKNKTLESIQNCIVVPDSMSDPSFKLMSSRGKGQQRATNNKLEKKSMSRPRSSGNVSALHSRQMSPGAQTHREQGLDSESASLDSNGQVRQSNSSIGFDFDDDIISVDDSVSVRSGTNVVKASQEYRHPAGKNVKKSVSLDNFSLITSEPPRSSGSSPLASSSVELNSPTANTRFENEKPHCFGADVDRQASRNNSAKSITSTSSANNMSSKNRNLKKCSSTPATAAQPSLKMKHQKDADNRSLSEDIWPVLRQQVFLGMAASSVPIRPVVSDLYEDLCQAGVRFVYFSPRNMRRSQKVAEKIGLETDWNCAISLRALGSGDEVDPHRYISQYADWDVKAKLPHGIDAIKQHLREVDNVPLLVSLFTDSNPSTITEMIDIFRDHGEVVMTLGSSYRSHNQNIYAHADIAVTIDMLPSELSRLSASSLDVISKYPVYHQSGLCQADLSLLFRLVGLQSCAFLQSPAPLPSDSNPDSIGEFHPSKLDTHFSPSADLLESVGLVQDGLTQSSSDRHLNLQTLMEAIRTGRLFVLNAQQSLGFLVISLSLTAMWSIFCQAIPITVPPIITPTLAMLFICFHIPAIAISLLFSPAPAHSEHNVLKITPRKNTLTIKPRDEDRFWWYTFCRCSVSCIAIFAVGWLASSSRLIAAEEGSEDADQRFAPAHSWSSRMLTMREAKLDGVFGRTHYTYIQDTMSCQLLLSLVAQSVTMLHRGQSISQMPLEFSNYFTYYSTVLTCILVHIVVISGRLLSRPDGAERFHNSDIGMWIAMCMFPLLEIAVGLRVNASDDSNYKRYLQYLRLEFDTRLGMYSPR